MVFLMCGHHITQEYYFKISATLTLSLEVK